MTEVSVAKRISQIPRRTAQTVTAAWNCPWKIKEQNNLLVRANASLPVSAKSSPVRTLSSLSVKLSPVRAEASIQVMTPHKISSRRGDVKEECGANMY